jgi:hypothetical protein
MLHAGRLNNSWFNWESLTKHLEERTKGVGSPKLLFENLDLTPIHPILWTDLHTEGPGRPVEYDTVRAWYDLSAAQDKPPSYIIARMDMMAVGVSRTYGIVRYL